MKRIKKRPIMLRFLDHVSHVGGILECAKHYEIEIVGYLVGETSKSYVVMTWVANDDLNDENNEGVAILKSTITKKKFL